MAEPIKEHPVIKRKKTDTSSKVKVTNIVINDPIKGRMASFRQVLVDSTPRPLVGENPNRKSLTIRNLDNTDVWMGDRHLITGKGSGGSGFILKSTDPPLQLKDSTGEIYVATATSTATLCIIEE